MSKNRLVNTHFWDDTFIVSLDPIEKLLFVYFLTNPLTNIAGAYEINIRRAAFDTGIDKEMILKILERFEKANKIYYRDGWILILNFIKNQSVNPKVMQGIETTVAACPQWIRDRLCIAYESLSHLNLNTNLNLNLKEGEKTEDGFSPPAPADKNSDNQASAGKPAEDAAPAEKPAPRPQPAEQKPTSDDRKKQRSVLMVKEITGRFPPKDLWDKIIREITRDTEFFRRSYLAWRSFGGNPQNFDRWLFEPNRTGKLPETYGSKYEPAKPPPAAKDSSSNGFQIEKADRESLREFAENFRREIEDGNRDFVMNQKEFFAPDDWAWIMREIGEKV